MMKTIFTMKDNKIRLEIKKGFFTVVHDRIVDIINYPVLITEAYMFLSDGELASSYTLKNKASGWLHWSLSFQHKKTAEPV